MASGAVSNVPVSIHCPINSGVLDELYLATPVISPYGLSSNSTSAAPEAVPLLLFVVVILAVHVVPSEEAIRTSPEYSKQLFALSESSENAMQGAGSLLSCVSSHFA